MKAHLPAGPLLLCVLFAACRSQDGAAGSEERTLRQPPNVLVVLMDTLRPDHLGFYGYPRETAPFLAELAARSTVFLEACSTSSWTAPATASLFTGLYPSRHGVLEGFAAHQRRAEQIRREGSSTLRLTRLPAAAATLPELFAGGGYRTFGVATNMNIGPEVGFDRGFDRFRKLKWNPDDPDRPPAVARVDDRTHASAEEAYAQLLEWEEEIRAGEPFFLYLHLNDVHKPYYGMAPWFRDSPDPRQRAISAYNSEISYADGVIRKIYERFGLAQGGVTVLLSDHGEAFGEHGLEGHSRGLYRELNRILLMVSAPDLGVESGRRSERVSINDVLPTLLELVGLGAPEDLDGSNLLPLLRGEAGRASRRLAQRTLFAHRKATDTNTWAIMRGPCKLIE